MKPQEKVFFMDPMKLIQSRMEHISKVCSPREAVFKCYSGTLKVRASRWIFNQDKASRDHDSVCNVYSTDCLFSEDTDGESHSPREGQVCGAGKATARGHWWSIQVILLFRCLFLIVSRFKSNKAPVLLLRHLFFPGKCLSWKGRMQSWKSSFQSWKDRRLNWKSRYRRGGYVFKLTVPNVLACCLI